MSAIVVASMSDIRKYARGALSVAGALDALPVPLADVEAAIGLSPAENLYEAGEVVPQRFASLLNRIRSSSTRVLGVLGFGQNTIFLDPELPEHRRRFTHGHELGHRALPWHEGAYVDDDSTLHPAAREELEQEANAFSAQLLFGIDRFTNMADSRPPSLAVPLDLSARFAASGHAAMRHYVAQSNRAMALLALGKFSTQRGGRTGLPLFAAHCVESQSFRDRFGDVTDLFPSHVTPEAFQFAATAMDLSSGLDQTEVDFAIDTKRGRTNFVAQCATLRLRWVLIRPVSRLHIRSPQVRVVHSHG